MRAVAEMRSSQDPLPGPFYDICRGLRSAYRWLWHDIPSWLGVEVPRMWTHISRDWHKHWPLAWLAGFLAVGVVLGRYLSWRVLVGAAVALPVGFVLGHLFWRWYTRRGEQIWGKQYGG